MARLSKASSFTIYEDAGIHSPGAGSIPETTGATSARKYELDRKTQLAEKTNTTTEVDDTTQAFALQQLDHDGTAPSDADDERRESAYTSTSLSSTAESVLRTDVDNVVPMHQPYMPPFIRPSFRRPQSVQRMQMSSPTPSRTASPRPSLLKSRSRAGTPRSVRSVTAKASPTARKIWVKEESSEDEEETRQDPLVLLHIVLLPVHTQWSEDSMLKTLPQRTLDQMRMLKSKLTGTLLERGILVPHPREDYGLLEERLLEALELQQPRITPCGHFVPPVSGGAVSSGSDDDSAPDSDSGVGSSLDDWPKTVCDTCLEPIESRLGNWDIKAFASNGLLRAPAWAAAWTEMERVDVEILPFIEDKARRQLDATVTIEDGDRQQNVRGERVIMAQPDEDQIETRIRQVQEVRSGSTDSKETESESCTPATKRAVGRANAVRSSTDMQQSLVAAREEALPTFYQPSQIPISVLLKNYIYLLAQDRRNMAIFFFVTLLALFMANRSSTSGPPRALDVVHTSYVDAQPLATHSLPLVEAATHSSPAAGAAPLVAETDDAMDSASDIVLPPNAQEVERHTGSDSL